MATQQPQINLNITFSDPETAAAFASAFSNGEAVQALLNMLSGHGSAGQNHRAATARKAKAVSDSAQGEWTAKQYRDWVKAYQESSGETVQDTEGNTVPMTGPLSKAWKAWLDSFIATVEGGTERPEFIDGAEVVDEAPADLKVTPVESEAPAPKQRFRRRANA